MQHSLVSAVLESGPITVSIFFFLVFMSFLSWAVIIAKSIQFTKMNKDDVEFLAYFQESTNIKGLNDKIISVDKQKIQGLFFIFLEAYAVVEEFVRRTPDLNFANPQMQVLKSNLEQGVERGLVRARTIEYTRRSRALPILATCSNVAPFIGLLGTVVGIINAFAKIGEMGSADLAFISPAISEALVATGMGLFVAIPASIAFNLFQSKTQQYRDDYNNFSLILKNKIQEYFLVKGADGNTVA